LRFGPELAELGEKRWRPRRKLRDKARHRRAAGVKQAPMSIRARRGLARIVQVADCESRFPTRGA
jgi:hypothetical protein